MEDLKGSFKERFSEYLNKIPVVNRRTYVIALCSILILGFATKSMIKIMRTTNGWNSLSTTDNQEVSQYQLEVLSDELNRVYDHFTSSRDSFLMKVEELDTLNRTMDNEN